MLDQALPNARLPIMATRRVQAWPRAFSERLNLSRQVKELLGGTTEELDQQQMVKRVVRDPPVIEEALEPMATQLQSAPEPFQQRGGVVVEESYIEACVAYLPPVSRQAMFEQQS
jgi:hypothetical protein